MYVVWAYFIPVTVPVFQGGDVVKIIDVKTSVQVLHAWYMGWYNDWGKTLQALVH